MSISLIGEKPSTRAGYAQAISRYYSRAAESILDCGNLLLDAKQALEHGQFQAMINADLPFGTRQAQRLMQIARNPAIANATRPTLLPPSVEALTELSKLPEALASSLISGGVNGKSLCSATRSDIRQFALAANRSKGVTESQTGSTRQFTSKPEPEEEPRTVWGQVIEKGKEPRTISLNSTEVKGKMQKITLNVIEVKRKPYKVKSATPPKTIKGKVVRYKTEEPPTDPQGLTRLKQAWAYANSDARQAFLDWVKD